MLIVSTSSRGIRAQQFKQRPFYFYGYSFGAPSSKVMLCNHLPHSRLRWYSDFSGLHLRTTENTENITELRPKMIQCTIVDSQRSLVLQHFDFFRLCSAQPKAYILCEAIRFHFGKN